MSHISLERRRRQPLQSKWIRAAEWDSDREKKERVATKFTVTYVAHGI